jgi:hypothetical protein
MKELDLGITVTEQDLKDPQVCVPYICFRLEIVCLRIFSRASAVS